jgi:hypothetical protein
MNQPPPEQSLDPSTPAGLDRLAEIVLRRLSGRVRHLYLCLQGGGLVIRGLAATYYAKQLVQHAVMAATAVPILANEVEVRVS